MPDTRRLKIGKYVLTNSDKYNRFRTRFTESDGSVHIGVEGKDLIVYYAKSGGRIEDGNGNIVPNERFWDFENKKAVEFEVEDKPKKEVKVEEKKEVKDDKKVATKQDKKNA